MKLGLKRVEASAKKTAEDVLKEAYEDAERKEYERLKAKFENK